MDGSDAARRALDRVERADCLAGANDARLLFMSFPPCPRRLIRRLALVASNGMSNGRMLDPPFANRREYRGDGKP